MSNINLLSIFLFTLYFHNKFCNSCSIVKSSSSSLSVSYSSLLIFIISDCLRSSESGFSSSSSSSHPPHPPPPPPPLSQLLLLLLLFLLHSLFLPDHDFGVWKESNISFFILDDSFFVNFFLLSNKNFKKTSLIL